MKPRDSGADSLNINGTTPQIQVEESENVSEGPDDEFAELDNVNVSEGPDDEFAELDNVMVRESGFLNVIKYRLDIKRYCRNVLHHYNNIFWKRGLYGQMLEKVDIEEKISQVWPNLYRHKTQLEPQQ